MKGSVVRGENSQRHLEESRLNTANSRVEQVMGEGIRRSGGGGDNQENTWEPREPVPKMTGLHRKGKAGEGKRSPAPGREKFRVGMG